MEEGLKNLYENVYADKVNEVRLQKASLIKNEIQKIMMYPVGPTVLHTVVNCKGHNFAHSWRIGAKLGAK